jgi:hypothetical protein
MSLNQDLLVTDDEATTGAAEMNDTDAYYERIMSQVDETIEETKKERDRRSQEVEAQATHEGYVVEFFVKGISPLQAMAYVSGDSVNILPTCDRDLCALYLTRHGTGIRPG